MSVRKQAVGNVTGLENEVEIIVRWLPQREFTEEYKYMGPLIVLYLRSHLLYVLMEVT